MLPKKGIIWLKSQAGRTCVGLCILRKTASPMKLRISTDG